MEAFSALILTLLMLLIRAVASLIAWPFLTLQRLAAEHPLRTARMVIGALVSGLVAHLFDLPYTLELTFGGGLISLLLGEIF